MRAFIALPLPAGYQEGVAALARELARDIRSRVSWVKPGNWHLTLKFLGDMPEPRVRQAAEALAGIAWKAFTLRAGKGGYFPSPKRPRVLWTGLGQGGDESAGLARAIDQALEPLGIEPERRPFQAHLTLCRVKQDRKGEAGPDDWAGILERVDATQWPAVQIEEFVLYQSILSGKGPTYSRIQSYPAS